jgi:hypothetical protein
MHQRAGFVASGLIVSLRLGMLNSGELQRFLEVDALKTSILSLFSMCFQLSV